MFRKIEHAPWFFFNKTIRNDLKIPFIKEEIQIFSTKYMEQFTVPEFIWFRPQTIITILIDSNDSLFWTYRQDFKPILHIQ